MERGDGGSGRPPAERKAAWRDGAVTYFHLLFYIAISGGQIFFNKASRTPHLTLTPRSLSRLAWMGA
jgi:hypothetical protein